MRHQIAAHMDAAARHVRARRIFPRSSPWDCDYLLSFLDRFRNRKMTTKTAKPIVKNTAGTLTLLRDELLRTSSSRSAMGSIEAHVSAHMHA
jgi:hypothetical protein